MVENKILKKEIIIDKELERIRDFEIDYKGDIYIVPDKEKAFLWKLSK